MAFAIFNDSIMIAIFHPDLREQSAGSGPIESVAWHIRVVPFLILGRNEAVGRLRAALIHLAREAFPIQRAGNCLAEFFISEPFELDRIDQRLAGGIDSGVLIE